MSCKVDLKNIGPDYMVKLVTGRNKFVKNKAEGYAFNMRKYPTITEKSIKKFLDDHEVNYESQKVYYVKDHGCITHYYIGAFYIPSKNLLIHVTDKEIRKYVKVDDYRTLDPSKAVHGTRIVKWQHNGQLSYAAMKQLYGLIKE